MSIRSLSYYAILISTRVICYGIGLGALAVSRIAMALSRGRILSVQDRLRH